MKGKRWSGFFLLTAILCFSAYKLLTIRGDKESAPTTATVERGEIVIGIKETGILKALRSSSVAVPRMRAWYGDMKVTKLVPEGTQVKKDDPLVWLSSQELEKRLKEQEFRVKRNEADIKKRLETLRFGRLTRSLTLKAKKAKLDFAKLELKLAKARYEKVKRLWAAELVPEKDVKKAEMDYYQTQLRTESAEAEYRKAEEEEATAERLKEIEIELTKSRSTWAQKRYGELKDSMDKTVLKSPAEGIVVYNKTWKGTGGFGTIKEGDRVWPGHAIMLIPDLSEMLVMTQVDETDLGKVKLDQEVRIRVQALPQLLLKGQVTEISSLAIERTKSQGAGSISQEEGSDVKVFEVTVKLTKSNLELRPGMTCSTQIVIETISHILHIPTKAVSREAERNVVYVLRGSKKEEREIKLGKNNGDEVVVLEGLTEGEQIILSEEVT
jgi:multidrug resistance efflux pump